MIKLILRFFYTVRVGLAGFAALVGIIMLPVDVPGLLESYPWLEQIMPSQNTLLIAFSFLCVAYIFWIDVRPLVRGWSQKRKSRAYEPLFVGGVEGAVMSLGDAVWQIYFATEGTEFGKWLRLAFAIGSRTRNCLYFATELSEDNQLDFFVLAEGSREYQKLNHDQFRDVLFDNGKYVPKGKRLIVNPNQSIRFGENVVYEKCVVRVNDLKRCVKEIKAGKKLGYTRKEHFEDETKSPQES